MLRKRQQQGPTSPSPLCHLLGGRRGGLNPLPWSCCQDSAWATFDVLLKPASELKVESAAPARLSCQPEGPQVSADIIALSPESEDFNLGTSSRRTSPRSSAIPMSPRREITQTHSIGIVLSNARDQK